MHVLLLTFGIFASITLIYVTLVFLFAQLREDNSIMDIFYGPAFAVSTWGTLILTKTTHETSYLVACLVTLWALRLSIRIARKNWGKPEDVRYAKWRSAWSMHGQVYFIVRSYLQINLLQGIVIVTVSLPLVLAIVYGGLVTAPFLIAGAMVFTLGLTLESVADRQLDHFIAQKKAGAEKANLITTGLFKYSRRPNYFGESLIWWGLALITLTTPLGYIGLLSPLVITYVVTKITGPMLEALFLEKYPEEYRAYMAQTSYFIPLPPKS